MTMQRTRTAAATFETRDQGERAVDRLRQAGFRDDQIGILTQQHDASSPAAAGAAAGAVAGAGIGTVWALGYDRGMPGYAAMLARFHAGKIASGSSAP